MSAEQLAVTSPLPVTLLSGFLGSGKTSLLKHILLNRQGLRVAVILNEISEVNIDSFALEGSRLLQAEEKVVELSNGCICCTLREDLLKQLRELHASGRYDAVLVESSGIAEPLQTAETFLIDLEDGHKALQDGIAPLDCCVTVLDASTTHEYLGEHLSEATTSPVPSASKAEKSVKGEAPTNGETISDLFYDQLSFANVVVLNKVDLLIQRHHARTRHRKGPSPLKSEEDEMDQQAVQKLKEYDQQFPLHSRMSSSLSSSTVTTAQQTAAADALKALVPILAKHSAVRELLSRVKATCPQAADIVIACHGMLPLEKVLRTGHFTMDFATQSNGWMQDILSGEAHVPETLEYGVSTTYFTANRPFHPERFFLWLDQYFVLRQMVPGDDEEQQPQQQQHAESGAEGPQNGSAATGDVTGGGDHPELDDLASEEGSVTSSWGEDHPEGDDDDEEDGNEEFEEVGENDEESEDEEAARDEQSLARRQRYGNLFRGKGYVWLGNPKRLGQVASLSQAGSELQLQYVGTWEEDFIDIADAQSNGALVSEHVDRPATSRATAAASSRTGTTFSINGLLGPSAHCVYCPPPVASQRLVFIGQHLLQDQLQQDLAAALLTDDEWTLLQKHMHTAMVKNAEREKLQKKMSWRDRGWLNDIFEDYFEDFPLPLTPPKIPESLLLKPKSSQKKTEAAPTQIKGKAATTSLSTKKRPRDDQW